MRRSRAAVFTILFLVVAPGTLAGVAPWALTGWRLGAAPPLLEIAGGLLVLAGIALRRGG